MRRRTPSKPRPKIDAVMLSRKLEKGAVQLSVKIGGAWVEVAEVTMKGDEGSALRSIDQIRETVRGMVQVPANYGVMLWEAKP